ncbi:unnamed protein product, partial [marine sediment metagenome]
MKEIDEAGFWNEIAFTKEHSPREFALTDITADGVDVLVKELGYLAGRVEGEVDGHLKRTPPLFSLMNTILFDDTPDLIGGDIDPASDSNDVLDDLFLLPVIKRHKAYLEEPGELLAREERVGFGVHWIKFSIGIPVFWEMRSAALVPKVLFPLKKYDRYASVIPSSFSFYHIISPCTGKSQFT